MLRLGITMLRLGITMLGLGKLVEGRILILLQVSALHIHCKVCLANVEPPIWGDQAVQQRWVERRVERRVLEPDSALSAWPGQCRTLYSG